MRALTVADLVMRVVKTMDGQTWVFAIKEHKLQENNMNVAFPKGISILLIKRRGTDL
jgi:hypothetical protein